MTYLEDINANRKQAIKALELQFKIADQKDDRALKAIISAALDSLYDLD